MAARLPLALLGGAVACAVIGGATIATRPAAVRGWRLEATVDPGDVAGTAVTVIRRRLEQRTDDGVRVARVRGGVAIELDGLGGDVVPDVKALLERTATLELRVAGHAIDGKGLGTAAMTYDPVSEDPRVAVELGADGELALAELTHGHVGEPLVVVIAGRAVATPAIDAAMTRGELVIPVAGASMEERERAAYDLWRALEQGLFAGQLRVVDARRYARRSATTAWVWFVVAGGLAAAGVWRRPRRPT